MVGRSLAFFLLSGLAVLPAMAGPVLYDINFLQGGQPIAGLPTASGHFTYDGSVVQGFSNFLVTWSGVTFDFTSSANVGASSTRCSGVGATQSYNFLGGSCGVTSWDGRADANTSLFVFFYSGGPTTWSLSSNIGLQFLPVDRNGTFTVSPSSTPEPTTTVLIPLGLGAILITRRRTARRPARV